MPSNFPKHMIRIISLKTLGIIIAFTQLFDLVLHAITNQLEFLRVTSNIIILLWLMLFLFGKMKISYFASFGTIGLYLFFNILFLAQAGLTNPAQGGAPRTLLFILVFLTIVLSTLFTLHHQRSGQIS